MGGVVGPQAGLLLYWGTSPDPSRLWRVIPVGNVVAEGSAGPVEAGLHFARARKCPFSCPDRGYPLLLTQYGGKTCPHKSPISATMYISDRILRERVRISSDPVGVFVGKHNFLENDVFGVREYLIPSLYGSGSSPRSALALISSKAAFANTSTPVKSRRPWRPGSLRPTDAHPLHSCAHRKQVPGFQRKPGLLEVACGEEGCYWVACGEDHCLYIEESSGLTGKTQTLDIENNRQLLNWCGNNTFLHRIK